jgi:uncharacterized membrane protein
MMYELLRNCFVLDDFMSGFDLFFEICGHIVRSHVPRLILCLFSKFRFLVLEKQFGGIHPITIGEVTYCLIVYILAIQFRDTLAENFNPH